MEDLTAMNLKAFNRAAQVQGTIKQVVIAGMPPCRAAVSEATSLMNAVRGKTSDKKRWNIAVIKAELTVPANIKPHATVVIDGATGQIEEEDFIDDAGMITCFVS